MTDESIFPKETLQYDPYIIREALNTCIAHQDYSKAGRITVQEHEDDYLIFCNCGDFIPESIENVLKAEYSASNYRNPFLATAMVNLNMIDTVGSGILKMFLAQKKRCFPLPDYDFSNHEVRMKHNELKNRYCHIRYNEQIAKSEGGQKTDFGGQKKWSETTQKIYELIKENPSMSRKKLSDTLSINPSAVQKHIEKLKKEGIIIRKNGAKGGHWEVL